MALKKLSFDKSHIKSVLIGALAGLIIGVLSTLFLSNFNPPDKDEGPSPSIVFDRIISQNELVCASQNYSIVDKATNSVKFFELFDIPLTNKSFWYRYVGVIKVGVNLKDASFSREGNTIRIALDQPYIVSNTPDMEKSGCLEERNNVFNPIHAEDVTAFEKQCREQSEREIGEGGIFEEAKENAQKNISDMFYSAFGDLYNVEFEWREPEQQ